ncbi:hypothetical protein D3C80_1401340 [compost metagenome]
MQPDGTVILTASRLVQNQPAALPCIQVTGAENALPAPFVYNHPVVVLEPEHVSPFVRPSGNDRSGNLPAVQVHAVRRIGMRSVRFVLVPHAESAAGQLMDAGVDYPVRAQLKPGTEGPVQQVRTGIVEHIAPVAGPAGRNALNVADVHMVQPVMPDNLRCPERVAAPFNIEPLQYSAVQPACPAVARGSNTEVCAVHPGHTFSLRRHSAVRINHPPFLCFPVPDNDRISRPVVYRVPE